MNFVINVWKYLVNIDKYTVIHGKPHIMRKNKAIKV